ncbi:hypothetical protein NEOKW01_1028 [Nematocida sp. AWRm80]|nr:hypothetical protein NEOKW01_1028 [Nematocida sp. AWRm80]
MAMVFYAYQRIRNNRSISIDSNIDKSIQNIKNSNYIEYTGIIKKISRLDKVYDLDINRLSDKKKIEEYMDLDINWIIIDSLLKILQSDTILRRGNLLVDIVCIQEYYWENKALCISYASIALYCLYSNNKLWKEMKLNGLFKNKEISRQECMKMLRNIILAGNVLYPGAAGIFPRNAISSPFKSLRVGHLNRSLVITKEFLPNYNCSYSRIIVGIYYMIKLQKKQEKSGIFSSQVYDAVKILLDEIEEKNILQYEEYIIDNVKNDVIMFLDYCITDIYSKCHTPYIKLIKYTDEEYGIHFSTFINEQLMTTIVMIDTMYHQYTDTQYPTAIIIKGVLDIPLNSHLLYKAYSTAYTKDNKLIHGIIKTCQIDSATLPKISQKDFLSYREYMFHKYLIADLNIMIKLTEVHNIVTTKISHWKASNTGPKCLGTRSYYCNDNIVHSSKLNDLVNKCIEQNFKFFTILEWNIRNIFTLKSTIYDMFMPYLEIYQKNIYCDDVINYSPTVYIYINYAYVYIHYSEFNVDLLSGSYFVKEALDGIEEDYPNINIKIEQSYMDKNLSNIMHLSMCVGLLPPE